MLIRIVGHFKNNPRNIDKMIAIKGLPEDFIFRDGPNGKELVHPWKPDIDKNIPYEIRHLCEPIQITFRYPPVERGANWVIESRQVKGLLIDYMTEPGREMWDKVERFVEGTLPRYEPVPVPVLLAKDPHSPFQTYMPKRDAMNHLELHESPIPEIDLRPYVNEREALIQKQQTAMRVDLPAPEPAPTTPEPEVPSAPEFKCDQCDYIHKSQRGIRMHTLKRHTTLQNVSVG